MLAATSGLGRQPDPGNGQGLRDDSGQAASVSLVAIVRYPPSAPGAYDCPSVISRRMIAAELSVAEGSGTGQAGRGRGQG